MDTIYISNTCPTCHLLLSQLQGWGRSAFRVRNIDTEPGAKQDLFSTGRRAVPTAVIHGSVITGAHEILGAMRRIYGG